MLSLKASSIPSFSVLIVSILPISSSSSTDNSAISKLINSNAFRILLYCSNEWYICFPFLSILAPSINGFLFPIQSPIIFSTLTLLALFILSIIDTFCSFDNFLPSTVILFKSFNMLNSCAVYEAPAALNSFL